MFVAPLLPAGRSCIDHYRRLRRYCVFSHEELTCKMAACPEKLDLNLAAATYREMFSIVQEERKLRKVLLERGITEAEREAFELLPDDERQCDKCKTTCFLSALACYNCTERLVCLYHTQDLCSCPTDKHYLRYRYTLDELLAMLHRLKVRAESFDSWGNRVKEALEQEEGSKIGFQELEHLKEEAMENKFPDNELLQRLNTVMSDIQHCHTISTELLTNPQSRSMTLTELQALVERMQNLPCVITQLGEVQMLLQTVEHFQNSAQALLGGNQWSQGPPALEQLQALLEQGTALPAEPLEVQLLRGLQGQGRWLEEVRCTLGPQGGEVTLGVLRTLMEAGCNVPQSPAVETAMAELQELLTIAERWEEKAQICLEHRQKLPLSTLDAIVNEAQLIPVQLPNILSLQGCLSHARAWVTDLEEIQNGEHYPCLDDLEGLVAIGRDLPVHMEELKQLELQVASAHSWRDKASKTFLKKNTQHSLLEVRGLERNIRVLCPFAEKQRGRGEGKEYRADTDSLGLTAQDLRDPGAIVSAFKEGEKREKEALWKLQEVNLAKPGLERSNGMEQDVSIPSVDLTKENEETPRLRSTPSPTSSSICVCGHPPRPPLLRCRLCKNWFHGGCVPFPSLLPPSSAPARSCWWDWDTRFLCPLCQRSRRPRLETILALLVALQRLPVRLPEGEALQCLTERAITWQGRAKQALDAPELRQALDVLRALGEGQGHGTRKDQLEERDGDDEEEEEVEGDGKKGNSVIVLSDTEGGDRDEGVIDLTEDRSPRKIAYKRAADATQTGFENGHSKKENYDSPTGVESLLSLVPLLKGPVIELSPVARAQLEELQLEGDLLEVTLDQIQGIHRILQAASQPPHHTLHTLILIELQEQRSTGRGGQTKDSKRKRKSQRGEGGGGGGVDGIPHSQDGSESKKTCPPSDIPSETLLHTPEVRSPT
ncbi:hypothetical protein AAFF_G00192730 [Aldrovandia affinis]|uniref:Zinc finger PHD-type domain-containing protein n=1 Tax=Aldrovandia affinis TaxID=143900 RepID=A0AAD7RJR6_9TELE|nr:hypothetical protein AAFF_G00192730 [Aldrovandia affinis]